MKLIRVSSLQAKRLLNSAAFLTRLRRPVRCDFDHDIPYLSGYSKDAKTIYFDRHLRRNFSFRGKVIDVADFLLVHEVSEKALIDLFGLRYQAAHHLATHMESQAIIAKYGPGVWKPYSRFLEPQIKHAEHEKITFLPPDLDLEPYRDEKDKNILRALQANKDIRTNKFRVVPRHKRKKS